MRLTMKHNITLGNAIALPCANYIMAGIKEELDG